MAIEKHVAGFFRLDDQGWARHANPWSGWSRFATGMVLPILAIWSRVWIGWWAALAFAAVALWLWLNPRLFPPVDHDRGWMSRGVFGERAFIEHREIATGLISVRRANLFNLVAAFGLIPLAYGLWVLDPVATILGASISIAGKMLFMGEMVALYDRMKATHPELAYRAGA
ncbi:DUF6653 family protein [Citromicrobium bathyomarinum]|uniref:DUF6653 family protein n=1 Tax=Citromicrobium bathyomarinum TaxID=72174 RepID=UPI00315B2E83